MSTTFEITAPDGTVYEVDGPEGATEEQALQQVQAQYQQQPVDNRGTSQPQQAPDPTEGMSNWQKILAGAGQAFASAGRGLRQSAQTMGAYGAEAQGDLSAQGRKNVVSDERAKIAEARKLDAPLLKTGAGKVGNFAGSLAALLPTMAIPGANTVAGAGIIGAGSSLLQPSTSTKETLTNAALGGAAGAGSQFVGQKVASWAGKRMATRAAAVQSDEAVNAVRDATLKEAKAAGYVVPPTNVNRSATATALESMGGKYATEATAAVRNQKVTNRLVRKELGLAETAPLTVETLKGVRSKAGQVYKSLQNAGEILTDDQYIDDLSGIAQSVDDVAKDFPDLNLSANEEISKLVDGMMKDKFSSKSAVELTKQLRKSASGNLSGMNSADPAKRALGTAQRDAAAAVEEQLIRHLEASGKPGLGKQFDDARKLIAKTYSVESALNPGTGNVVAKNLAAQLKKGKPLSGEFETIAKFAQSFPKAAAEITDSKGVSNLTVTLATGGAGTALLTGNPGVAAGLLAVPAASYATRSGVLSKAGQNMLATPSYAPNTLGTATLKGVNRLSKYALPIGLVEAQQQ